MNQETMELFRTITEMRAVPGQELELRRFVEAELKRHTDELVHDRLGSVFGVFRGDEQGPRIMVAGHMDEVGLMVTAITESGMLKFVTLGGWNAQTMLAQRMEVVTDDGPVIGVIGSTPPHLLDDAARSKVVDIKSMYLDVGADNREDAMSMGIRPGQAIVPVCPFTPMANPKKIMAKAWDNRYGVGLALELAQELKGAEHPNVIYTGATVQEEVGLRGARTAANLVQPDLFLALDASPAADSTGDRTAMGQLGKGALLRVQDPGMITHRGLVELIRDTAETEGIRYQYYFSQGGTDAGQVHLSGIGVPSAVIGLPARYIHTAAAIMHVDDYDAAKQLLFRLVRKLDRSTFETILSR
ncbi:M42 family metallopeptidase [Paenibacillus pasadenensis]|uniref:Glutamyl aminopeptidase n=1 Tax=Paenibacillus pasadenensis TaxID=217090 RepID=A0A2N5NAK2_9BACL|nr:MULTISPECIES: M42 family metallopeptidase [Paenibacillus]PLT47345.1 Glutamyl aminopeptidase [Paenibacillus pasadenensis]QGG57633.1 peptidase M28 [Paenibacillus sp. B01]